MRVCSTTRVVKQSGLGGSIRKEGCFLIIIQATKFCVRSSGS